ncbi:unnamed protein product [Sphagnum troendelagicum]|uniref:Uncharacterized protein n=1 Tax=Sphagnum jensenii TaxID=128206 RepID=A0ABP0WYF7_9BRYO
MIPALSNQWPPVSRFASGEQITLRLSSGSLTRTIIAIAEQQYGNADVNVTSGTTEFQLRIPANKDYSRLNTCISPGLVYNPGSIRPLQADSIPSISHVMNSWLQNEFQLQVLWRPYMLLKFNRTFESFYVQREIQLQQMAKLYGNRPATDLKSVVLFTEAVNQVQPHIHKSCISGFKAADYKSRTYLILMHSKGT